MTPGYIREIIEDLIDVMPHIPEMNCSCHISPPCGDCVDNSWNRELLDHAKGIRNYLRTLELIQANQLP